MDKALWESTVRVITPSRETRSKIMTRVALGSTQNQTTASSTIPGMVCECTRSWLQRWVWAHTARGDDTFFSQLRNTSVDPNNEGSRDVTSAPAWWVLPCASTHASSSSLKHVSLPKLLGTCQTRKWLCTEAPAFTTTKEPDQPSRVLWQSQACGKCLSRVVLLLRSPQSHQTRTFNHTETERVLR